MSKRSSKLSNSTKQLSLKVNRCGQVRKSPGCQVRCFRHVHLSGDPGVDSGHSGGVISLGWLGSPLGFQSTGAGGSGWGSRPLCRGCTVTVWWTGFVITEACTCSPLLVDYLLQLSSNPLSHQLICSVYGCTNTLVIGYSTENSFEYPGIHIKHIFAWLMSNYEYPKENETFHFRINHQVTLAPSTKHVHFLLFLPLCGWYISPCKIQRFELYN